MRAGWPPHWVGRLTVVQLLCLAEERPPGTPAPMKDMDAYLAMLERDAADEDEWGRRN